MGTPRILGEGLAQWFSGQEKHLNQDCALVVTTLERERYSKDNEVLLKNSFITVEWKLTSGAFTKTYGFSKLELLILKCRNKVRRKGGFLSRCFCYVIAQ